jgi:hypothetical protein
MLGRMAPAGAPSDWYAVSTRPAKAPTCDGVVTHASSTPSVEGGTGTGASQTICGLSRITSSPTASAAARRSSSAPSTTFTVYPVPRAPNHSSAVSITRAAGVVGSRRTTPFNDTGKSDAVAHSISPSRSTTAPPAPDQRPSSRQNST